LSLGTCIRNLPTSRLIRSNAHISDEHKAYLRRLPQHLRLRLDDLNVLLVHGSPRKVNEYLFEDRAVDYFERMMDTAQADVLVCGHTHLPYHKRLPSGRQVINAGSVGKPKDYDPRAGYITLTVSGREVAVEFIRVPYDVERAAQAIEATPAIGGMPHPYAQMLRDGAG
jgi:diadenosine tetraphosphatase ApaH/serine/threonine PP2A family protein phosphatase